MRKFAIKTLGCKTNRIESDQIKELLCLNGFCYSENIVECDFLVVNSCSVTASADEKSILFAKNAKDINPNVKIILTGCYAQLNAKSASTNRLFDYILGNGQKFDILNVMHDGQKASVSDIFEETEFKGLTLNSLSRTRAAIKIQDGCNNRCSYCTIPLARGNSRSNEVKNILKQAEIFAENGFKEVVLTGIHIGQWGSDLSPRLTLLNLLESLETSSIERYRLGSLNPHELDEELLSFLSASEKFCPHFHLSLQNTLDKTLKRMNRHYSYEECFELVEKLNSLFNLPFLGSDIITGFPGETEKDFENSFENLEKLNLSQIHVFPYSLRKNTAAYSMENQVPQEKKTKRAKLIQKLSDEKIKKFLEKNKNTEHETMIQKVKDKETGLLKGLTRNYINVLIDAEPIYQNTLQTVKIIDIEDKKAYGKIL